MANCAIDNNIPQQPALSLMQRWRDVWLGRELDGAAFLTDDALDAVTSAIRCCRSAAARREGIRLLTGARKARETFSDHMFDLAEWVEWTYEDGDLAPAAGVLS